MNSQLHPISSTRCSSLPSPTSAGSSDTTELMIPNGRLFLAAILDLFSRFVVGWAVSAVNNRHVTIKALDMALRRRCPDAGLLRTIPTRGSTYASEDYLRGTSPGIGIVCSMSRRGNCYDNAVMESWNGTLKNENSAKALRWSAGREGEALRLHIECFYNQQRLCIRPSATCRRPRVRARIHLEHRGMTTVERSSVENGVPLHFCPRSDARVRDQAWVSPRSGPHSRLH